MASLPESAGEAPARRAAALRGASAAPANASGTVTMSRSTWRAERRTRGGDQGGERRSDAQIARSMISSRARVNGCIGDATRRTRRGRSHLTGGELEGVAEVALHLHLGALAVRRRLALQHVQVRRQPVGGGRLRGGRRFGHLAVEIGGSSGAASVRTRARKNLEVGPLARTTILSRITLDSRLGESRGGALWGDGGPSLARGNRRHASRHSRQLLSAGLPGWHVTHFWEDLTRTGEAVISCLSNCVALTFKCHINCSDRMSCSRGAFCWAKKSLKAAASTR